MSPEPDIVHTRSARSTKTEVGLITPTAMFRTQVPLAVNFPTRLLPVSAT